MRLAVRHTPYDQAPSVLNIGERTNANGSKRFRDAMLAHDWDDCTALAKDAVRAGSHVLDVCVDYTGQDGVADMAEVAGRFATQSTLPLVLDSTEAPVIECGLQRIAGKPIINSVNLEEGDGRGHPARPVPLPGPGVRRRRRSARASTPRARPAPRNGNCGRRSPYTTWPSAVTGSCPRTCSSTPWPSPSAPGWRRAAGTPSRRSRA